MTTTRRALAVSALGALAVAGLSVGGAIAQDPQKLTVWTYYVHGGQTDAMDQQNAELWAASHPDVAIEHVQIPFDQLASRLLGSVVTGDGPDVVLDNVVVDFPTLASSGALLDLTPYWDAYEDKAQFPASSVWTWEDRVYNLLSYTNLLGLFMNQDALDRLGIAAPTTIEEFETAMAAVKADGTSTPLAMSGVASPEGAWLFFPILLGEGVDYCNLDGASLQTGLERLRSWVDQGWLPQDAATWDQADAWQAFFSGNYAFGLNGNWNLGDVRNNATFTVSTTRYPAGSQGSHVFPGGEAIGIGGTTQVPDLAWEYIKTAWLSKEAGLINFNASGQIPTRGDLAQDPAITQDALALPFVQAAAETGNWPKNEKTADMQNAIGTAVSEIISGQTTPADAASRAADAVKAALEAGGGSC